MCIKIISKNPVIVDYFSNNPHLMFISINNTRRTFLPFDHLIIDQFDQSWESGSAGSQYFGRIRHRVHGIRLSDIVSCYVVYCIVFFSQKYTYRTELESGFWIKMVRLELIRLILIRDPYFWSCRLWICFLEGMIQFRSISLRFRCPDLEYWPVEDGYVKAFWHCQI